MGGTMDYARFRMRNGILPRRSLDSSDPYVYDQVPPTLQDDPVYVLKNLLAGEMNRMERDVLGLGPYDDMEINNCVKVTGLPREQCLKVLRWFLDWPEPYCKDCGAPEDPRPRCNKHHGWPDV